MKTMTPSDVVSYLKDPSREPSLDSWQLVDVRTPDEFAEVRAKTAVNIPLDRISKQSLEAAGIDCSKEVFLICRSGGRSAMACEKLQDEGLSQLINIEGGTMLWVQEGHEAVSG